LALLIWDAKQFGVEVELFDAQHRQLFDLINQLHDAMRSGQGKSVIGKVLTELRRYTVSHFGAEEDAMRKAGYAGLSQHQAEHRKFVAQVDDFARKYQEGNALLTMDVMSFLQDWLRKHIQSTDRSYSSELKGVRN